MIWKLTSGGRPTQETKEQKREEANRYIEKLQARGYTVSVVEHEHYLDIQYEPTRDTTSTD